MNQNFCDRYPDLCNNSRFILGGPNDNARQHNINPFEPPIIKNSLGLTRPKKEDKTKDKITETSNSLIGKLKTHRVGELTDEFPPILEDYMRGIYKRNVRGFETELEGKKFNISINKTTKEMRINFEGASPTDDNVMRILKNKKIIGPDVEEERAILKALNLKNGKATLDGIDYEVKLIGHSYGGYKARLYGAETNSPSEIFNGHIMPYNTFPKTEAQANMHTILTDPTDLKFLENLPNNVSHTYYQPLTPESVETSKAVNGVVSEPSFMDPHRATAWEDLDRETQESLIADIKTKWPEFGIGIVALAPSIYEASTNPDYDPSSDPMLGSINSLVGENTDPDYQWSDLNPPTGSFDYIIWRTLHPLTEAIASPTNEMKAKEHAEEIINSENNKYYTGPLETFTYKGEDYNYKNINGSVMWLPLEGTSIPDEVINAYRDQPLENAADDPNLIYEEPF